MPWTLFGARKRVICFLPSTIIGALGAFVPRNTTAGASIIALRFGFCIALLTTGAFAQNTFPANGNVGIGTTQPTFPLQVTTAYSGGSSAGIVSTGNEASISYTAGGGTFWHVGTLANGNFFLWNNYINTFAATFAQNGNVGIGTPTPISRFHAVSRGGFGPENPDGTSQMSNVPIVAQTDTTAFGILNTDGRQVFALNVDSDGGTSSSRGAITFYDKTDGNWHQDIALNNGKVGIGTTTPQYALSVNGTIQAKEVLVNTGWSDYVFDPEYKVRPLAEVAAFIKANHHLPDIPSEAEVKENGVSLGDMQSKLLAKIEELTLHMIQLDEKNKALEKRVALIPPAIVARNGKNGGK